MRLQMPHPRRHPMSVLWMWHLVVHLLLQPAQLEVIEQSGDWQEYVWPSLQNQTISPFHDWKRDREYSLRFHLRTGSIQASHWGTLHAYLKICKSNHNFSWRYKHQKAKEVNHTLKSRAFEYWNYSSKGSANKIQDYLKADFCATSVHGNPSEQV